MGCSFGLRVAVDTHPRWPASYALYESGLVVNGIRDSLRLILFVGTGFCRIFTWRLFFSGVQDYFVIRFLHCSGHPTALAAPLGKPACDLLTLRDVTPARKGLSPSGKFAIFDSLCSCRAHTANKQKRQNDYIWEGSFAYLRTVITNYWKLSCHEEINCLILKKNVDGCNDFWFWPLTK
jgi:hypothetical protein